MEIIVLCKLQIFCLALTVFIGLLYFSSRRVNNKLHKSFGRILIVLPLYLLSDIATVITVNNIEKYGIWNDVVHRIFFVFIILLVYLFCNHMNYVIEVEEGDSHHKKVIMIANIVIFLSASIFSIFAKSDYDFTKITGFATGKFAGAAFVAVGTYIVIIAVLYFTHWKILPGKKRLAIGMSLIIEGLGLYFQMMHTELLLSGCVFTMMMLTFFLTLENPDAVLLEEVAKEKEIADAANASKSAFLSVVSHEIRTPMNAVVGMTDILLREKDELSPKQEKYLRNIKNSGASLVMILNDILDQSKIEAGKMEIVPERYELRPMLDDVRMIIENRIGTKPVHLLYEVDENIPDNLVGDSLRIRQILINLMNNAVKFTEEGYIQLTINIAEKKDDELMLRFSVKDSGMGIKPEELDKLGEAFTQVDIEKNHKKEGTGLGLSISRDFIAMMGGCLELTSIYGKGTEFFFTISQGISTSSEAEGAFKTQPWQDEVDFTAPSARILVVDDIELNLSIVEALLEPINMQVDLADSGENAIRMVSENEYDLIFMDYMMPYMDGIETTKNIRGISEKHKKVPIVAMSGDTSDETTENFKLAGIDDFAEKPVNIKQLKKILLKWTDTNKIVRE